MLYHGSKTHIKGNLEPRTSFEGEPLVYATTDIWYALIRSGNFDMKKFLIREEHDYNYHELCEVYPGAFETVFNRPGYIYEVNDENFKFTRYTEYVSDKEVEISNIIYIPNVLNELTKRPEIFKMIKFEDSETYWKNIKGGRNGYIERKQKIIDNLFKGA